MLNGLEILIARMKTHPEEFVLDGRWADLIAKVDKHLTEEERQAVKDGFTGIARDTFNEVIMKAIGDTEYDDVPKQIKRLNKAGGKVLQGLIRRREAEALLFEGKEWHEV